MNHNTLSGDSQPAALGSADVSNEEMIDKVSVIIVNYNSWDLVSCCLDALSTAAGKVQYEVVIVDNGSNTLPPPYLQSRDSMVRIVRLKKNLGFAGGVNTGIRASQSEFVLLLNPDTVMAAGSLDQMVAFIASRAGTAVVGPKLVMKNGKIDMACHRLFPRYRDLWYVLLGLHLAFPHSREFARFNLSYLDPDEIAEVDIVSGACMLARRSAIEQVGLLDEEFFLYGEDLDWCQRFRLAGWQVHYYPHAQVVHYKGAAMARSGWRPAFEFYRSIFLLYRKHIYAQSPLVLNLLFMLGLIVRASFGVVERKLQTRARNKVIAAKL